MSSDIKATVQSQPITATVSGSGPISASVGSSVVSASVSGGIGPQGAPGNAGAGLGDLTDVNLSGVQDGDVLRYDSSKWHNVNQTQVTDGGNW
jgi:hypothetical protein